MGIFDLFSNTIDEDDIKLLPFELRDIFLNPYKPLGLDRNNAKVIEGAGGEILRNMFRKLILRSNSHFLQSTTMKYNSFQLIFAYYLIRGVIPKKIKEILIILNDIPDYLTFQPDDVLPLLRPCRYIPPKPTNSAKLTSLNNSNQNSYRGFRMLHVHYNSYYINNVYYLYPKTIYKFDIFYVMRKHTIELDYQSFKEFHYEIIKELVQYPILPVYYTGESIDELGLKLANYLETIHYILADSRRFSPRLMNFLNIDYEKVQTEEEGILCSLMDSVDLPSGSVWHIIDEEWLGKWRKFVMGRGPRRYFPPGPITNHHLMQQFKLDINPDENEEDDNNNNENNNINSNGNNPLNTITTTTTNKNNNSNNNNNNNKNNNSNNNNNKKNKDFNNNDTSKANNNNNNNSNNNDNNNEINRTLSLASDYRLINYNIWTFYQLVHGGGPIISRRDKDIYSPFACSYLQAAVIIQTRIRIFLDKLKRKHLFMLKLSQSQAAKRVIYELTSDYVNEKAELLIKQQNETRMNENRLAAALFTQQVWRKKNKYAVAENLEKKIYDQELFSSVLNVTKDIPASTNSDIVIKDSHPIIHIGNANVYERKLIESDGAIPFEISKKPGTEDAIIVKPTNFDFFEGSKLLSINSVPLAPLSYQQIKIKLEEASYPLIIELEKPINNETIEKNKLSSIITIPIDNKIIRFNALKLLLSSGIYLIKHNTNNLNEHITVFRMSEREIYYRSKSDSSKTEDSLWNKFSLFSIKFICKGDESNIIRLKRLKSEVCFEIVLENRRFVFELPSTNKLKQLESDGLLPFIDSSAVLLKNKKLQNNKEVINNNNNNENDDDEENDNIVNNHLLNNNINNNNNYNNNNIISQKSLQDPASRNNHTKKRRQTRFSFVIPALTTNNSSTIPTTQKMSPKSLMSKNITIPSSSISTFHENESLQKQCNFLVEGLKDIVKEVRNTQVFVDRSGLPIKRTKPKESFPVEVEFLTELGDLPLLVADTTFLRNISSFNITEYQKG
eukprot:gene12343-16554_t